MEADVLRWWACSSRIRGQPNLTIPRRFGDEKGTHQLTGNTLTLKNAEGKQTRLTIFPDEMLNGKIQLNVEGMSLDPIK